MTGAGGVQAVWTQLNYAAKERGPRRVDLRRPGPAASRSTPTDCLIRNGREAEVDLETTGFVLLNRPTRVTDFEDEAEVMRTYYAECKALAAELTGASQTFTFDHLLRQNGTQVAGGGLGGGGRTGPEGGGGFIHSVHMDYTDASTWGEYLALHGARVPRDARRVVVLNFWRPLVDVVRDNALAVCDARTVRSEDLTEVEIFGYGPPSYSWHDIGISTYSVAPSERHRWYYFPRMTRDEVLVIKSYDSEGVIGRAAPHSAFTDPASPEGTERRSIELRVLCFIA